MKKATGYTLVELMVVVAIIGIIAAVAYPSYQGYMRDTYQTQAVGDMRLCALALDRYYSNGFTYVGAPDQDSPVADHICTMHSPSDSPLDRAQFEIGFYDLTQSNYIVRATPLNQGDCVQMTADGAMSECP
ncbi:MAG: type IV pilin protein [Pseudomonadota bacterium]